MNTSKPGWKTTEFWITAVLLLADVAAASTGFLPPETAAIVATATGAVYKLARAASKFGADEVGAAARAALAGTGGSGATLAQSHEAAKSLGSALAPKAE